MLAVNNRAVELPLMVPDVDEAEHAFADATANLQRVQGDENITPYRRRQQYAGMVGVGKGLCAGCEKRRQSNGVV